MDLQRSIIERLLVDAFSEQCQLACSLFRGMDSLEAEGEVLGVAGGIAINQCAESDLVGDA